MATYLLALVVSDFPHEETHYGMTQVRIWAQPSVLGHQTQHAMRVAVKSLEFFEDYFDIAYPLKKLGISFTTSDHTLEERILFLNQRYIRIAGAPGCRYGELGSHFLSTTIDYLHAWCAHRTQSAVCIRCFGA